MGGLRRLGISLLALVLLLAFPVFAGIDIGGTGSGFVVSSDGYILTNEHVVEGATEVKVTVGGREYTATVVATLAGSDLALLKIRAQGLPVVRLGNSDTLHRGDDVYALGCPRGICGTVTRGGIANIGVTLRTDGDRVIRDTLMLDVTIDHGSSGGPLVNSRGEVVGINTAIAQRDYGFAIPINQALPLLRRVPGFSTAEMGRATAELTPREIVALVEPSSVFVRATRIIPLAQLLPDLAAAGGSGWSGSTFSASPVAQWLASRGLDVSWRDNSGVRSSNWSKGEHVEVMVIMLATAEDAARAATLLFSSYEHPPEGRWATLAEGQVSVHGVRTHQIIYWEERIGAAFASHVIHRDSNSINLRLRTVFSVDRLAFMVRYDWRSGAGCGRLIDPERCYHYENGWVVRRSLDGSETRLKSAVEFATDYEPFVHATVARALEVLSP